jgi:fumarate hydratase subunit beta
MIKLQIPLKQEDILKLKVGDQVLLSGVIFTARDKAHQFLLDENFENIKNGVIYHCGPIIKDNKVIAAGPTSSYRMNIFTPEVIEKYEIKAIIGKAGMDNNVLQALKGKAVYFSAIGGCGALYASSIKVKNVYKKEFGMPEAIWEFEIKDFPVVVTMDTNGNSLYEDILNKSKKEYNELVK